MNSVESPTYSPKVRKETFSLEEIKQRYEKGDQRILNLHPDAELFKFLIEQGAAKEDFTKYFVGKKFYLKMGIGSNTHNCYWNDVFHLTIACDSQNWQKRVAATVAIWNGRHGYWEWNTHGDFDNLSLFKEEGLIDRDTTLEDLEHDRLRSKGYFFMPPQVETNIRYRLGLEKLDVESAAPMISKCVHEKVTERTKGSGQYDSLPSRSDLEKGVYTLSNETRRG